MRTPENYMSELLVDWHVQEEVRRAAHVLHSAMRRRGDNRGLSRRLDWLVDGAADTTRCAGDERRRVRVAVAENSAASEALPAARIWVPGAKIVKWGPYPLCVAVSDASVEPTTIASAARCGEYASTFAVPPADST
jgi:hypothetical protein